MPTHQKKLFPNHLLKKVVLKGQLTKKATPQRIDYDFAANVNVFAAKFSRLICNNFAANFFNEFAATVNEFAVIFGDFPIFKNVTISRLNVTKSRLIINEIAANN